MLSHVFVDPMNLNIHCPFGSVLASTNSRGINLSLLAAECSAVFTSYSLILSVISCKAGLLWVYKELKDAKMLYLYFEFLGKSFHNKQQIGTF